MSLPILKKARPETVQKSFEVMTTMQDTFNCYHDFKRNKKILWSCIMDVILKERENEKWSQRPTITVLLLLFETGLGGSFNRNVGQQAS